MITPEDYRKGIIEALQLASSAKAQIEYQAKVPIAQVVAEVFCWWQDIYQPNEASTLIAFTEKEIESMAEYERVLVQVAKTTQTIQIEEFHDSQEFKRLSEAAKLVLEAMGATGRVAD